MAKGELFAGSWEGKMELQFGNVNQEAHVL